MPLLGICRGLQAMNVARGGTLHQHVDDHRQATRRDRGRRTPWPWSPGSLLAGLTGAGRARGQLVPPPGGRRLGAGCASPRPPPDGTVEALEDPAAPFLLGVQWHAEGMVDRPEQLALFTGLIARRLGAAAGARRLSAAGLEPGARVARPSKPAAG